MIKPTCLLACGLVVLGSLASAAAPDPKAVPGTATPRELAREAYYQIEANVFDRKQLEDAYVKINQAADKNRNEAYVYLAVSLGTLVTGYTIGNWYDKQTFAGNSIDQSLAYAKQALALDPNLGQAHAHLARLLILRGEFKDAEQHLKKAKELDPQSFYPWYFEGILYEKQANVQQGMKAFAVAESKIAQTHQRRILSEHKQLLAKLAGDPTLQEKLLKENIANNPTHPQVNGNYAQFLMCQGRYAEAIVQWEKTLKIGGYPRAVDQLEEAKKLLAKQRKHKQREGSTLVQATDCTENAKG